MGGFSSISSSATDFLCGLGEVRQHLWASICHLSSAIAAPSLRALGRIKLLSGQQKIQRLLGFAAKQLGIIGQLRHPKGQVNAEKKRGKHLPVQGTLFLSLNATKMIS